MKSSSERSPLNVPQSGDAWYLAVRKLRAWIAPEGEEPVRPYLMIILNLDSGIIQGTELGNKPDTQDVEKFLSNTMSRPAKEIGVRPQRPAELHFEDRRLMTELADWLRGIGVRERYRPQTENMNVLQRDLESHLREGGIELPGLLEVRKVKPKLVEGLFSAAKEFYLAEPWIKLGNEHTLAVQSSQQASPWYVTVMGQGGVEYGLALYKRWEEVERAYLYQNQPLETLTSGEYNSLTFVNITAVPFGDLDALETYGWEVAGAQAYPFPVVFSSEEVRRPDREELLWYEAALRALAKFVPEHWREDAEGNPQPVEARIPVDISTGNAMVTVRYPAGELPKGSQRLPRREAETEEEFEIPLDRRAMEGEMARMIGEFSEGQLDPELQKAQALMYEAWEETDPEERIALARQALSISKDCADAYVLLAEEEAERVDEALSYYEAGVAAGERALGAAYFEENAGHFWGLLETRPYMRALEGKASRLWQLDRRGDALEIYQEMLRLNPGDNQGIRYLLADLLLETNREEALVELLAEYPEDWSAVWKYTQALLAYRQGGADERARQALLDAFEENLLVPDYLTGEKRVPNRLPDYIGFGDETEAATYAANHLNYWRKTPGAVEWLERLAAEEDLPKRRLKAGGLDIGDSVKVKTGVRDPDTGDDISGWQGRVIEIEPGQAGTLVLIAWDSRTLAEMPAEMIETSEDEGLEWAEMYLLVDEVEPTEARDTLEEREEMLEQLESQYAWSFLGEQGRRIRSVLAEVDPVDDRAALEAWEAFLSKRLKFPFEAEVAEYQEGGPYKIGDRLQVVGLAGIDEWHGVLAEVGGKKRRGEFPLYDLDAVKTRSANYRHLDDYAVWFEERG